VRRLPSFLFAALLAGSLAAAPAAGAAERKVPFGFLGTMADGRLVEPRAPVARETGAMVRTGVERLRLAVYWDEAQPDAAAAPDFHRAERVIGAAARRGLPVLVTIVRAPAWARKDPGRDWSPPVDPAAYGRFAGAVATRFGSRGTFWAEHPEIPRVPVADYQIWNEPAGFEAGRPSAFWDDPDEHYAARYVAMLRAARAEILAADPAATIILAGLFGRAWTTLPEILRAGGGGLFDQMAMQIFTREPRDLVRAVRLTRKAMLAEGATPVPVVLSEVSWTASKGRLRGRRTEGYEVTRKQQALRLADAFVRLAAKREELQIAGVFWYTWLSRHASEDYRFDYAGLRRLTPEGRVVGTPAQAAYRRVAQRLEGCAKRAIRDC
jgi:hypothetical protein